MSNPRSRGQYAKGAERREQIIQTATDVFATGGFEGTALKQVAELVGVREATLFHYFRGKQELLTAVLSERDRRAAQVIEGDELSLDVLPRVADRNRDQPGLTTLYAVASATANDPGHDSHQYFQGRYADLVTRLSSDITESQARGRTRTDLPAEVLARIVVAAFDGLQLQWLYDKDVDMAEGLRSVIDVLLAPPGEAKSVEAKPGEAKSGGAKE